MKYKILITSCIFLLLATLAYALNSTLKRDSFGVSIQGALRPTVAQKLSFYTTTDNAVNSADFQYPVIEITATKDCFYKLGDNTVVATDNDYFLPANQPKWVIVGTNVRIGALGATDNGVLYIMELY